MPRAPSQAIHNPVLAGPNETKFDPSMTPQRGPIDMAQALESPAESLIAVDPEAIIAATKKDYLDQLAFNEQPVTVVIAQSNDRNAPKHVRCAVNGKGAEIHVNGRWVEYTWLPVGAVITVKRKYLEVLARSRTDTFRTVEVSPTPQPNQDGFYLEPNTVPVAPFTVRHDPAGAQGDDWYRRVCNEF